MENYQVLRKIGSGNFAKVYLAVHTQTGRKVALKVIEKRAVSMNKKLFLRVRREISNLKRIRHSNVVQIYESFETKSQFVIAMEYLPNGELFDYVWKRQGLEEAEAKEIFTQIAEGVHYCHMNSIVHRDLKLENILLDSNQQPKLADFGFSKEVEHDRFLETYCGSPLYASPEMILGRPYFGSECDIWSLGVILYTMLTATMPFDDRNIPMFLSCVEKGIYPEPADVSEKAKDLLSKMLNPHPHSRASIEDVLSHPWLQEQSHTEQHRRHLSRHPATTSLSSQAAQAITDPTVTQTGKKGGHAQLKVCSNCYRRDSLECRHTEQTKHDKPHHLQPVLRKNSSGYSSASDMSSLPSPISPYPSKPSTPVCSLTDSQ